MRGGKRGRQQAREAKYTVGVDLGVDGQDQTVVYMSHDNRDGSHTIEAIFRLSVPESLIRTRTVIEGEFVEIERRSDHLLAGGPEP